MSESSGVEATEALKAIKNDAVRSAVAVMVCDLYDYDMTTFKRDAARITLADWEEDFRPPPEVRNTLLRSLWWIFGVYFGGDYGELVKKCVETKNNAG